jgi:alpha-ketoglutarate-dependent taurine dioxygenase
MTTILGDDVAVVHEASNRDFPLFVRPVNPRLGLDLEESVKWIRSSTDKLQRILSRVGAVVLRGFPVNDTDDFNRLIDHLPVHDFAYAGGVAKRKHLGGKVFETTTSPITEVSLPLHQEMAYQSTYPTKLTFFCMQAPSVGGSTTLGDIRRIEAAIPVRFRDEVRDRGVLYRRHMRETDSVAADPSERKVWDDTRHKTWPETFYTDSKSEVEEMCRATNLQHRWLDDGSLTTECRTAGYASHPVTGESHWFNHIHPMASPRAAFGEDYWRAYDAYYGRSDARYPRPSEVLFGDGTVMDREVVDSLYPLYSDLTVAFTWQAGDVMFVDNLLTAHGRSPYTGSRNVQVALSAGW